MNRFPVPLFRRLAALRHRGSRRLLAGLPAIVLAGLLLPAAVVVAFAAPPAAGWPIAAAVVGGQFVCLLSFLRLAFGRRIAARLAALAASADALADGDFDRPAEVGGGDEIGRLAAAIERMRRLVGAAAAERQAVVDRLPIGVLVVRNRVVESANRRAEDLLGYAPGGLAGRPAERLYPTRDAYLDFGARAYARIEAGGRFAETLALRAHDGRDVRVVFSGCALDPRSPADASVWSIQPLDDAAPGNRA